MVVDVRLLEAEYDAGKKIETLKIVTQHFALEGKIKNTLCKQTSYYFTA